MVPKLHFPVFLAAIKRWGPALCWMLFIFGSSADSGSVRHTSQLIDPFCQWLWPNITFEQLETVHFLVRKAAHMTEFALLALLFLRALSYDRGDARKWISSAWVLATAYAASDEFHQSFIPGRNPSVVDVLIDSAGAALGLFACYLFLRHQAKKTARKPAKPAANLPTASAPRPTYAEQLLCTLQGEDVENHSQVRFEVQDRLQRDHGGRLILGRSSTAAQLCVKNTSVSAQHFSLIFRSGKIEVEDLNSSNGTRVNGRKLTPSKPVPLADGDRIEAGEVLLHFRRLA